MNDDPIAGELWFHTGARHYYFIEKVKYKKATRLTTGGFVEPCPDELWVWWHNLNMDIRDCQDSKWFMQNCKKES